MNRQMDFHNNRTAALLSRQRHRANLRAWESSAGFGVEPPAECDFAAAVQRMEDGEI
jgi:hypothetical protein